MSINSFRTGATSSGPRRNSGGGNGGRRVNYRQRAKIPGEGQPPEAYVFFDADYPDQFAWNEQKRAFEDPAPNRPYNHAKTHKVRYVDPQTGKERYDEFDCTTGRDPYNPQPCVGCYLAERKSKTVNGARDIYEFNVAHLMPYHKVPLVDRDNPTQLVMKKDDKGQPTNEPVLVEERCTIQNCKYCTLNQQYRASGQYQGDAYPIVPGMHQFLSVGSGHRDNLKSIDDQVQSICANCGTNIRKLRFVCGRCNTNLLELSTSGWSDDQVKQFELHEYQCPHCRQVGLPVAQGECGYDPSFINQIGGCGPGVQPKPMSLFDSVFYLQRTGKDQQSKITLIKAIPIDRFKLANGQPLRDVLGTLMQKPFDFSRNHQPLPTEEQAKKCKVPNPYAQQGVPMPNYGQGQVPQPGSVPPYAPYQPQQPPQVYGNPQQAPQVYGQQPPPPQPGYGPPQQQPQPPVAYPGQPIPGRPPY